MPQALQVLHKLLKARIKQSESILVSNHGVGICVLTTTVLYLALRLFNSTHRLFPFTSHCHHIHYFAIDYKPIKFIVASAVRMLNITCFGWSAGSTRSTRRILLFLGSRMRNCPNCTFWGCGMGREKNAFCKDWKFMTYLYTRSIVETVEPSHRISYNLRTRRGNSSPWRCFYVIILKI